MPEILLLIAPRQAQQLKLEHGEFLDPETFTDFPSGDQRQVDVLYRTETLEGSPKIVLVHVEVEAEFRRHFDERMACYGMSLFLRHRAPIFPVGLFLRGGSTPDSPEIQPRVVQFDAVDFWVHRFRYLAFHLSAASAEKYLAKQEPIAAALASLMRFTRGSVAEHKLACLRGIAASHELNAARSFQLVNLVDNYLPLKENKRVEFEKKISNSTNLEVVTMDLAWAQKLYTEGRAEGEAIGLERGEQAGQLEGARRVLLQQLKIRFGELPDRTIARIQSCQQLEQLERWSAAVLSAPDLAAMGLEA